MRIKISHWQNESQIWKSFTTESRQNRNFFVYSPNNLHNFTHTEKLNSVSDTENLPNLAAAANDANLCLTCSTWAIPFNGVFHSTHPQDLWSVLGDIFVPSIHWILFAISFAESFLESLDVDKSSSQGEVPLHPISFICFCATLCLQNYSWKHKSWCSANSPLVVVCIGPQKWGKQKRRKGFEERR